MGSLFFWYQQLQVDYNYDIKISTQNSPTEMVKIALSCRLTHCCASVYSFTVCLENIDGKEKKQK